MTVTRLHKQQVNNVGDYVWDKSADYLKSEKGKEIQLIIESEAECVMLTEEVIFTLVFSAAKSS